MTENRIESDERLRPILASGEAAEISEIQNPITRSVVTLSPPFVCTYEDQLQQFNRYFGLWCEAMWMTGYMDPSEFKADRGWIDADVPGMRWVPSDGDKRGYRTV